MLARLNGNQVFLTIAYSLLVLGSLVGLALLVRSTSARRRSAVERDRLEEGENRWGIVVVALLVTMLAATIWSLPYDDTADAGRDAQIVEVRGQQFGWNIQPSEVEAGRPVTFRMASKDVQHGFGIYEGNKLLGQVQVPAAGEPVQEYTMTFAAPGTYEVLCLEFCGFQHHMMRGRLRVR
jgi:cytochrome c oxidase subunit 2